MDTSEPIRDKSVSDKGADTVLSTVRVVLQNLSECDESLALFDLARVTHKFEEWRSLLPRVQPHYAVKCNPDRTFLRELHTAGCNFDCATKAEIHEALSVGTSPDNIVFSHPCKLRTDLQYAKTKGVRLMSFDNSTELKKVADIFPGARLLLRLVCEDTTAQCPMSAKFGVVRADWEPLLAEAVNLGLQIVGVSFHVGSGCTDPASFQKALSDAKDVFELASTKGFVMNVLDIGGGWPGEDTEEVNFAKIAGVVAKKLDDSFPAEAFPDLRMIAEPGRFFAHSAVSLLTKVIAKAKPSVSEAAGGGENFRYYLNDGVYGSFNCIIYDHAEVEPEMLKPAMGPAKPCWIFGPTCDGFDCILKDYEMPELQEGDWLLWRNMGAYTSAAGSNFNGFALARSLYFNGLTPLSSLELHSSPSVSPVRSSPARSSPVRSSGSSDDSLGLLDGNECRVLDMSLSPASTQASAAMSNAERQLHPSMHFQRLEEELAIKKGWQFVRPSASKIVLLLFCSLMWALKTIGFSWAAHRRQFSPFSPPIVQSTVLALCILLALLCKYGSVELLKVCDRRYLWFAVSGSLEGLMFCLLNLALTKAAATNVTVLMQGQFFVVIVLQASLLRTFPSAVQIVCVASALCLLFSYQMATLYGHRVGDGEANSIIPAFGAAFCSGACDLALEYFSKRSMNTVTNRNADLMRCLFFHESFKIPIACLMFFAFDNQFGTAGLLSGWDYSVVIGGVGAGALALVFVNTSVVLNGALPTNLALSLEVGIVYLLDIFLLQTSVFNIVTFLEMCCFAGLIAAYNLDVLSVLSWEAAYSKASHSVRLLGQRYSFQEAQGALFP